MVNFATERICVPTIPNLKGQATLEIGEGPLNMVPRYMNQQARVAIGFEIGGTPSVRQGDSSKGYVARGQAASLPFDKDCFEYIGARLASNFQGDVIKAIKEIARVTAPGGQGFIADFHPFGLYAKKGTDRIRSIESTIRGIEDYYKICRTAGLRIVDLREAFLDETFRTMFEGDEIQTYRNVKGTPLVVYIFFIKPRPK
jgi:SAM-dependent methyltransferase